MANIAAVEIRNLVKRFGEVAAVDSVTLSISSGEIVSLLGSSGCGKTTTLRCLAGLERPTDGEIVVAGRRVASRSEWVPPEKRDIGMMFQSYALWPHMTVFSNVAMGLELRRVPREELQRRVQRALDLMELSGLGDRYPSQLSGGQQQRVALARSIVIEPKVLLFDEPLSNLDAKIRERVRLELRDLLKRLEITAVYVTHDQAEAMVISDRIVVMNRGRIEQQGNAQEIYERPATRFVADFVGTVNFIPARALAAGDSAQPACLESEDGLRFLSTAKQAVGEGVVAFRPEHALVANAGGANCWHVRVEKQVYLGSVLETHARLGRWPVRLQGLAAVPGSELAIHVPPERILFFPGAQ